MKIDDNNQPRFMGLCGKRLNLAVSVIATTGFLLFGYDQGVMSGIIDAAPFAETFPEAGRPGLQGSVWQAFITAIYEVGCLLGAIFTLIFGDRIGRRRNIMAGAAIMILGVIIQITAVKNQASTTQFLIGRTITGIGNGMNTSTIPSYQAECSKSHNRGLLICIEGGCVAIGTMIAYWIDYGCHFGPEELTWRFPISFQIVFGVIICFFMTYLPESPRWLLSHDRADEALTVMSALRGLPRDDPEVNNSLQVLQDSIRASGAGARTSYRDLLTGGKSQHFRRMLLGVSSQMFQQLSGCNAVIYYFPILFQDNLGTSEGLTLLLGGINMVVYALFATTSWFLIERVGRRKLFLYGTVGQTISMVIVFACLINPSSAKGSAVGLFTYIAVFGATWLPLPWLYPAEINPLRTRAKANAVSTCSNWLWNFFVVMITPIMNTNIGWKTYLVFAVLNASFFPIIYFFYPETAGRSLEEVDLIFAKGYLENMSYVKAAKELPQLTEDEVNEKAREYGFISDDDEAGQLKDARFGEKEAELVATDNAQFA
ncbi:general substrate transporter [Delphinella strobiligena]|nr:general substrate transporter [Delphinella strobiligena]